MSQLQRSPRLVVVASCSNSKTLPAAPTLLLRDLAGRSDRCREWSRRLCLARPRLPLRSLYKGQQWQAYLALEEAARTIRGVAVDLWVVSAGIGLHAATAEAPGYGATFSAGPDAVGTSLASKQSWWKTLRSRNDAPTFTELRSRYDEMLIVLSPPYLQVVAPELVLLDDDGVAIVTSASTGHPREISSRGLPAAVGGSALTLNQRAAERFLGLNRTGSLGDLTAQARWDEWATPLRSQRTFERNRLDDASVTEFIRRRMDEAPAPASRLLRRLRDSGFACEQGRFGRIYRETVGGAQ